MSPTSRWAVLASLVCCLVALGALAAGVAMPAAAHLENENDYHVRLDDAGDATVTHRVTFDRTNETQERTFQELLTNETAKQEYADRYEADVDALAANASEATGREMSIERVTVVVAEDDDLGVVTVTVSWAGLAAVEDDRLVVTEPFASGYNPDTPVTVTAPRDYEVATATPEPADRTGGSATWDANASLEGFEFVAQPVESEGIGDDLVEVRSEEDGPGFDPLVGLGALLAIGVLAIRRSEYSE